MVDIDMKEKDAIRQAGIEFTLKKRPRCIGGGAFSDLVEEMNRNYPFEAGAKWMLDKACEWMDDIDFDMEYWSAEDGFCKEKFITAFKKAMEE